ncbi:MAG TPA: GTPase Era [Polyangiaceae bacterium]
MRFGTVTLIGRSNVGKSTFLNTVLGEPLAITSPLPQTTRDVLLGVAQHDDAQIAFLDTPGLHQPKSELGRRMNLAALEAARTTDCMLFMTDTRRLTTKETGIAERVADEDRSLLGLLPKLGRAPVVLVINKIDLLRDKRQLIPLIDEFQKYAEFASVVPISVTQSDGLERVLGAIAGLLPEGPPGYDADTLTDRPARYFVCEFIREQVLNLAAREVPHAVAVSVDEIDENEHDFRASATIHVQKQGQRAILVGSGGSVIKNIGIGARKRLGDLLGKRVHLRLFVRITPRWKDVPRQLNELGYEAVASRETAGIAHGHGWSNVHKRGRQ